MTPREKAERAKQLLEEPLFKAVMHDLREQMVSRLETSVIEDAEAEHQVVLSLKTLKLFTSGLQRYVQDGLVEQKQAESASFIDRIRQRYRA